tara:strand:- start:1678 stop:2811 length:1134 start_codon:yes stop_codon:yes gene_type:complete
MAIGNGITCEITQTIDRTECIGNSLSKINGNFSAIDNGLCQLTNEVSGLSNTVGGILPSLPSLMSLRMSLSPSASLTTGDIKDASTIYIHPYNGNSVSLYNTTTNKWEILFLTSIKNKSLIGLLANTNYDVFIYHDGVDFQFEFQEWNSNLPPTLFILDGAIVKSSGERNKRLIGCLRTTNTGQTEVSFGRTAAVGGSHPKVFLWNLFNQLPLSFSILESGNGWTSPTVTSGTNAIRSWTSTAAGATAGNNGPFEMFGGANNKISFICRDPEVITLNSVMYIQNTTAVCTYFSYSLDLETPTVAQLFEKTPGVPIFRTCIADTAITQSYNNTIQPGYHYMQLVSMTYSGTVSQYLVWTGSQGGLRHSYATIGILSNF